MLFYLLLGFIVAWLFYAADKCSSNNAVKWSFLSISFLLTTIIEGCRNVNIGTDMYGYGLSYFSEAKRFSNLVSYLKNQDNEYAYFLLNYICSRLGSINLFMFIAACIKSILVGLTAWHFRHKMNTFLFIFCYMMFFYWYNFSLMRQGIALCVALYSLRWFYDENYIGFGICTVIAYLFHSSGFFILFIPLMECMSRSKYATLLVCIGCVVVYYSAVQLFMFVVSSGLFLEGRYDHYEDSGVDTAKSNILIFVIYLILTFIFRTDNKRLKYYIRTSSFLGLIFLFLSSLFEVAFRISFYQMLLLFIVIPMYIYEIKSSFKRQFVTFCIALLYIVHIYVNSNHGLADTIPYKSVILGI